MKPSHILAIPIPMIVNTFTCALTVTRHVEMAVNMDRFLMKSPKTVIGHDMYRNGNFN